MARVLLLGYDPETVDFSDPALPPGMTVEKVRTGIAVALKQFAERGWEGEVGFIRPDETAGPTVERQLASKSYDCVVIGAGVRLPPRGLAFFEAVINAVHKAAPRAAIAFNTRPDDSADAAARWLPAATHTLLNAALAARRGGLEDHLPPRVLKQLPQALSSACTYSGFKGRRRAILPVASKSAAAIAGAARAFAASDPPP